MPEIFDSIQDAVLGAADQPWILLALYAFCTIDGFFPPVPSESIVIALASLSMHGDAVSLWFVIPIAAAGAMSGDLIAFAIGRRIPIHRLRIFRSGRGQASLAWAEAQLRRRGGVFILSARYIPVGRVAVNMTAGAVGFPLRRFVAYDLVAAVMWAIYSTVIGVVAGAIFHDQPLLSVVVGVVGGIIIGFGLDKVLARLGHGEVELRPREGRGPAVEQAETAERAEPSEA
ncbi:hypothetical protein C8046_07055 [Serinibacter arcticus]|uniref:VTT domain-containing protein n=1 Tax=Serinibacter arcticus TaxID=1655435 RepID=A0A2U1ZTY1_9MICO|nr:DedA family protein [Serinibacter arcticus]PWD50439.1 hypothetical protein C8046_07055 [Serinibacter arcticus]